MTAPATTDGVVEVTQVDRDAADTIVAAAGGKCWSDPGAVEAVAIAHAVGRSSAREEAFRSGYREGQADAPDDECEVSLRLYTQGMQIADSSRLAALSQPASGQSEHK